MKWIDDGDTFLVDDHGRRVAIQLDGDRPGHFVVYDWKSRKSVEPTSGEWVCDGAEEECRSRALEIYSAPN